MRRSVVAFLVLAFTLSVGAPARAEGCAGPSTGGEWPSYGGTVDGSRFQPAEDALDGASLAPVFAASTGIGHALFSTAVVADGCIFVGTQVGGEIQAYNADTGELVWRSEPLGAMYAVAVHDGKVFGIFSENGTGAAAVDQATGQTVWNTGGLETGGSGVSASALAFDGLVFVPTSGPDLTNDAHPSYSILDADTGAALKKTYPIPDEEYAQGYAGGGIWTTGVVDEGTKHLFAGTANPNSYEREHAHTNSIVKIDVDRTRPTFGEIVDVYKGEVDQYVEGLDDQAACETAGDLQPAGYSVFCVQLDIDFGASPNLWKDAEGRTIVGELQKSGVYHAVYADTMERKWATVLSAPCPPCNVATSAVDDTSVYAAVTPGLLYALDRESGAVRWTAPAGDYHYAPPVSVANGTVYTLGTASTLHAYDAATGTLSGLYALSATAGDTCSTLGGGVSVARSKVYAVCDAGGSSGGWVVAYGAA